MAQTVQGPEATARALARAQALLKQINAQKVASEGELAAARLRLTEFEGRLAQAESDLKVARADLAGTKARLATTTQRRTIAEKRLAQTQAALQKTRGALRSTTGTLRETEAARVALEEVRATAHAELTAAEAMNLELYKINAELLVKYVGESTWQRLLRSEPFTGIRGVQLENVAQQYQHRLEDNRRTPGDGAGVEPQPATAQ